MNTKRRLLLGTITLIGLGLFVALWLNYSNQIKTTNPINPYEQYALALQTPSPAKEMSAFVQALDKITSISGWSVVSVVFQDGQGNAILKSTGGSSTQLLTISQSKGMSVYFSPNNVTLHFSVVLTHRELSESMSSVDKTVDTLKKRLDGVLPKTAVVVEQATTNPVFKKITITLSLDNNSPEILNTIGTKVDDLPVNIDVITVTLNKGQLTGNIKISAIGN